MLAIEGLSLALESLSLGSLPLVQDVSLALEPGEMVGLVGESGCGKSVTALAILGLNAMPPLRVTGGRIRFEGEDLLQAPAERLRAVRGGRIGMIFQEPMTALNPVFPVGEQVAEVLRIHRRLSRAAALDRAVALLDLVGLPAPRALAARFPHQLSGGQRQRVTIAIALACEPRLLVADEPTTALDVTVQAEILDLIDRLRRELDMACLLITHDLGVVGEVCDRVAVMYAGRVVETGPVAAVLPGPRHRYTEALLRTAPAANPPGTPLPSIEGRVPAPAERDAGCAFRARCGFSIPPCETGVPPLLGAHAHACWNPA